MAWHKMRRYLLAHLRHIDLQCFAGGKFDQIAQFGSSRLITKKFKVASLIKNQCYEAKIIFQTKR